MSRGAVGDVATGLNVTFEARRRYAELVDVLLRDAQPEQAEAVARLAVEQGVWADPLQRPVDYLPGLPGQPVHDPERFWFTAHLEAHYPQMRAEVDAVLSDPERAFASVDEPLLRAGRWDQVVLFEAGRRQEAACALLPVTAAVVEQIPEATTFGPGVVTLSLMQPGSHVRPHCGRTNGQLRVHLGLRVPGGETLRVGQELLTWQEGRCLVFDDSFEHEVWHEGTADRVVLIFDMAHPDLDDAHRQRLVDHNPTPEERIVAFMRDRGLSGIARRDGKIVFSPNPSMRTVVTRYLADTDTRGAELDERSQLRWLRS
jgi:aspartate beta-hydroxylase